MSGRADYMPTGGRDICDGLHRYFVATDGTVEGVNSIKIWVVVVCTVCKDSHLIEHIMAKAAVKTETASA